MLKYLVPLIIFSAFVQAAASSDELLDGYTPGPVYPAEEVTLLRPGVLKATCIEDPEGFRLDSGPTRTGSVIVRRANGEEMVINVSMPIATEFGYEAPIDSKLQEAAAKTCAILDSSLGEQITVTLQKISEVDEGRTLDQMYLRKLVVPSQSYTFENDSELYAPLPK